MLGIKVNLSDAEKTKAILINKNAIDKSFKIKKEDNSIIFPVLFEVEGFDVVNCDFERVSNREKNLRKLLESHLTAEELSKLKTSFDIVGDIAILEIDDDLRHKENLIAEVLLESHKNIKTVLRKDDKHDGEFRTQKMKFLAGENTKEALHKENNVVLKLNVETVYFSPRLSSERKRISADVKSGEKILVMFSGCAPYPCVLAKNTSAEHVTGIELNPEGHKYGLLNIKLNKLSNVSLINDDVKRACFNFKEKFDRILMPLPKNAEDFLESALFVAKKGTIIHFYNFLHEDEFVEAERKVKDACVKAGFVYKKLKLVKAGQQSPRTYRICLDFKVL